jgi:hypothetical protein
MLSTRIWDFFWNLGGRPADLEAWQMPWLFFISVMCMMGLVGISWIFVYLYYRKRPRPFELALKEASQNKGSTL